MHLLLGTCLTVAAALHVPSSPARHDLQTLQAERYRQAWDGLGLGRTHSGALLGHLQVDAALLGGVERNPLLLLDGGSGMLPRTPLSPRAGALVHTRFTGELALAVGLFHWVELSVALPWTGFQDRGAGISAADADAGPLDHVALGDVRLGGKLRLLRAPQFPVDVALVPQVTLPVGVNFRAFDIIQPGAVRRTRRNLETEGWAQGYTSEGFPTLQPELAVSRDTWGLFLGANGGVRLRRPFQFRDTTISHEALARGGVGFKLARFADHVSWVPAFPVELGLEAEAAAPLNLPYVAVPYLTPGAHKGSTSVVVPALLQSYQPSLEVNAQAGLDLLGVHPFLGGGVGLLQGWGTPDWRVVAGVRLGTAAFTGTPRPDSDGDGVADRADRCPHQAGPARNQGCPLPDADADGAPDEVDRCPLEPGDRPDGCPRPSPELLGLEVAQPKDAPDADKDGIPDAMDLCPQQAEDLDGFQDLDGCPDPDNDDDGVPDAQDLCPMVAETLNGFEDQDGCPDEVPQHPGDADGDGVPDERDECPLEPEDTNGVRDADGCPDAPVSSWSAPLMPRLLWLSRALPAAAPDKDQDHDGISDAEDACPREPEDMDGFQDEDGCPDLDNDNDGIPDTADACPLEAEILNGFQDDDGCPDLAPPLPPGDADGDGIPDDVDQCPLEPETVNGIRDADGCPEYALRPRALPPGVPVPAAAAIPATAPAGAPPVPHAVTPEPRADRPALVPQLPPDADGDGVPDREDACPNQAEDMDGFQDEDGCPDPDNDGDGIPDLADRCPLEAEILNGYRDDDGCPDAAPDEDGDGIPDAADRCPTEPEDFNGVDDGDGCPDGMRLALLVRGDSDGDGVEDAEDACPLDAEDLDGFQDADGCPDPDNDHDGVPDATDQCPLAAETINGIADEDGCPDRGESSVELKEQQIAIREKVYFPSGGTLVSGRSRSLLNQVARLLQAYPDLDLEVAGHTDDRGSAEANRQLSQQRAQSVLEELVARGVARRRLNAVGFGGTQPRVSNNTAAGRDENRRVEFNVKGATP